MSESGRIFRHQLPGPPGQVPHGKTLTHVGVCLNGRNLAVWATSQNSVVAAMASKRLPELTELQWGDEVEVSDCREGDTSPAVFNIVRAATAAHEHAFHVPDASKEIFLEFMSMAWDRGTHQRRVSNMEVEGGIDNELGVTMNFAANLALYDQWKGLIPQEQSSNN